MAASVQDSLKNDQQNPTSPYYLHPGENPNMVLVTPHLDGTNYHSWSRAMKCALLSKNKYKFFNGEILEPSRNDAKYEAWERCNVTVFSRITRSLKTQIAQNIVYIDNARDLWKDLEERFSKGSHFRISDLLQEINSIKQGERSINGYYTDSKTLWEELDSLHPLPACTCKSKCTCNVIKTMTGYMESERIMCFLKGLGESYNTVKTQVLLMDPLPGVNCVFSLVLQQEIHLNESTVMDTKILINNANQYGQKMNGKNYGKQCSFCNKMNHMADECYSKHEFPPWIKQRMGHAANAIGK